MNSAAWAGVAAEPAVEDKAADQTGAPARVKGKVAVGSLNQSTILPINNNEGR
jgi:hypothetical protein